MFQAYNVVTFKSLDSKTKISLYSIYESLGNEEVQHFLSSFFCPMIFPQKEKSELQDRTKFLGASWNCFIENATVTSMTFVV